MEGERYIIKSSRGYIEYIETYEGLREYGYTPLKKEAKSWTWKAIDRALREYKKITGLDAVKVEVDK